MVKHGSINLKQFQLLVFLFTACTLRRTENVGMPLFLTTFTWYNIKSIINILDLQAEITKDRQFDFGKCVALVNNRLVNVTKKDKGMHN